MRDATVATCPSMQEWVLSTLRDGVHTLDELGALLPDANWAQLFLAVDRLSRNGSIGVRRLGYGDYVLALRDDCHMSSRNELTG